MSGDKDFNVFATDEERERYEARFSLESFSREPLINGVPLSKYMSALPPQKAEGICTKCKEHTEIGNSCCGDEYVHID